MKTVRDLRRRVVLGQFDAKGDDDLGRERDYEQDPRDPGVPFPCRPPTRAISHDW
jgi:hypothetical protein